MTDDIVLQTAQAMKRFAKSIAIITASDDQGRYATPSSAVTNLTNKPPTLLLPMEKTASLYALLSSGVPFAVNLLGANHQEVVNACIKLKGEERFSSGNWQKWDNGAPFLEDAQASFVCELEKLYEFETHGIIIGRVVAVNHASHADPLLYMDGGLKTL